MPPLHGSSVDEQRGRAPTVPMPSRTTTRPRRRGRPSRRRPDPAARHRAPASAASDNAATRSASSAGRVMTCWAPTEIAVCQSAGCGSPRLIMMTWRAPRQRGHRSSACPRRVEQDRRGRRSRPCRLGGCATWTTATSGCGGDAVDLVAHRRVGKQRQDAVCSSSVHTVGAVRPTPAPVREHLWMKSRTVYNARNVCSKYGSENGDSATTRTRQPRRDPAKRRKTPGKGTTPARGGGGGGRRVSAPGGRADAHPA